MPILPVRGIDLYYEQHGSGRVILFSSGLGGKGAYWQAQVEDMSRDHKVIVFDQRGVGLSGSAEPPFSISGLGRDVIALMDALRIETVIFVGHSTGGAVGQWLAANHGDRFAAMVLSATWTAMDARLRVMFETRKATLLGLGAEEYVRQSLLWTYPPDWFDAAEGRLADIVRTMASDLTATRVLEGRLDAILQSDHGDCHIAPGLPVLVTYADDDYLIPQRYSLAVAANIPGAQQMCLTSGGHHFPQTRAKQFNTLVRRFLSEVDTARTDRTRL